MSQSVSNNIGSSEEKKQNFIVWFLLWFIRRPGMQFLFLLTAILLPAVALVFTVVLPALTFDPIPVNEQRQFISDTLKTKNTDIPGEQRPFYIDLLNKEQKLSFLQNRLELARQDSIYLVLNLQDSLLDIEIKGLPVQRCRLLSVDASNRLKVAPHEDIQAWLGKPFTLKKEFATIPKVPMLIVDAPKDTNEAAKLPKKPMEPEKTAVFFTLMFDRNLVLFVEQAEAVVPEEEMLVAGYRQVNDSLFKRSVIEKVIQPMPSDLPIFIKVKMNEGDARSIYRSIPHAGVAKLLINPLNETK